MNMDTAFQLNQLVIDTVNNFIMLKLTKYGWFSTSLEHNQILSRGILRHIDDRCTRDGQEAILEALAQESTQVDLAEMISTVPFTFERAPTDKDILSFARSVLEFIHEICSDHYKSILRVPAITSSDRILLYDPNFSQNRAFPFFSLPAELRNMVYREVLVLPDGAVVRLFTSPALLQTNRLFRAEAMPIFYSENYFEITIKRSPREMTLAAGRCRPNLDKRIFQRFLRLWPVFNVHGSNCLQYVRRITLIYELSMDNGHSFGFDAFDKRLGFRFSNDPFEEDLDENYGEESDTESESDSSDDGFGPDFEELEAEADDLQPGNSNSNGYEYEADTDIEEDPEDDFDPVGGFELNRGTFDWPSRHKTYFHLWYRASEEVRDQLWAVYPIERLTDMLWRCARDCPLASENVDFLCDDIQYWTAGGTPFERYDIATDGFFYPDIEEV